MKRTNGMDLFSMEEIRLRGVYTIPDITIYNFELRRKDSKKCFTIAEVSKDWRAWV